jgi:hypothetical protein
MSRQLDLVRTAVANSTINSRQLPVNDANLMGFWAALESDLPILWERCEYQGPDTVDTGGRMWGKIHTCRICRQASTHKPAIWCLSRSRLSAGGTGWKVVSEPEASFRCAAE